MKTETKNGNVLEITVNSSTDVKPEINRLIVEQGGKVFKLMENSRSLEDAFLDATGVKLYIQTKNRIFEKYNCQL
ncbi:hypothetical protein SDC9_159739 [bioreactor metagenome]|uniref:DUF4162 domain-containing protein n=1 Tax=bioreactor metagenome TaxID=1076179 RepID=A0A645FDH8_9ZZZZ